MNKPLLFFNGSHVMLIPEQYVPEQPARDCKPGVCEGFQPDTGYCTCEVRSKRYNDELEAAKKSAIRVENATSEPSDGNYDLIKILDWRLFIKPGEYHTLPEGYKYEVGLGTENGIIGEVAEIISTAIPREQTPWEEVRDYLSDPEELAYLKSKYTLSLAQPEQSEDEWFKVYNVCTQMEKYSAIETLSKLYSITKRTP